MAESTDRKERKITIQQFLLVCGVTGAVGAVLMAIISAAFFFLGISKWFILIDSGSVIFRTPDVPINLWAMIIAFVVHVYWGGFLALGIGYFFLMAGKKNYILHGVLYGVFMYIVIRNFFVPVSLVNAGDLTLDIPSAMVALFTHFIWGGLTSYLLAQLLPFKENTITHNVETGKVEGVPFLPAPAI